LFTNPIKGVKITEKGDLVFEGSVIKEDPVKRYRVHNSTSYH